MAHFGNHGIDLVAWQLATFAGLCPLSNLDLHHVRIDQILGRHTKAAGCHLLDGRAHGVAIGHRLVAVALFTAFTGVRLAANPVHGNRQCCMGLTRNRAVGHSARGKTLHDILG